MDEVLHGGFNEVTLLGVTTANVYYVVFVVNCKAIKFLKRQPVGHGS